MAKKKTTTKKNKEKITADKKVKDTCFTIMPFRGWFDMYYADIYVPAVEAADLKPTRADDLFRTSTIINDIWTMTKKAKVILADLTGKNPNVLYELGLAHAIAKPAVLVTENIDDVPFDLRHLRVIIYDKNEPNWGDILSGKITKAISEVLEAPEKSVLATFLSTESTGNEIEVSPLERSYVNARGD